MGLALGIMAGLIRIVKTSTRIALDVIPADVVVNSTLAIAWQTAKNNESNKNIYNSTICNIRKTTISKKTM